MATHPKTKISMTTSKTDVRGTMTLAMLLFRRLDKSDPALAAFQKMINFRRLGNGINFFRRAMESNFPDRVIRPGDPLEHQCETGRISIVTPGKINFHQRVLFKQVLAVRRIWPAVSKDMRPSGRNGPRRDLRACSRSLFGSRLIFEACDYGVEALRLDLGIEFRPEVPHVGNTFNGHVKHQPARIAVNHAVVDRHLRAIIRANDRLSRLYGLGFDRREMATFRTRSWLNSRTPSAYLRNSDP